jgi:threonylcarbamoyladenosine tRNA methylthiotransferase MtaB
MKVRFETFGCRLNRAEALQREADFLAAGWERVDDFMDADLVVVRGCSVTSKAQAECERLVARIRRKRPDAKVLVEGCLHDKGDDDPLPPSDGSALPKRTARAFLKAQDGCSCHCSFCIVPQFRGEPQSMPFDDLLRRAERLRDEGGYGEIVLTGCNLSLYASGGKRLPDLVAALAALGGFRLRLGSIEPGAVAEETVAAAAESPNVCRSLHLAVQSASNAVLRAMRRPYGTQELESLLSRIGALLPDCGLGCDIMTGFPGETELDFRLSAAFVARHRFSNVHAFPFSRRPGTVAAALPRQCDHDTRSKRAHEIAAIARRIRADFATALRNREVEIVVEDEENVAGWTSEYIWCKVPHAKRGEFPRKSIRRVRVVSAEAGKLVAAPISAL